MDRLVVNKPDIATFEKLFNGWRDLRVRCMEQNMVDAEDLNIFRVLNISHLETKLHTPFLLDLLKSEGTHGQGTLFFRAFLEQLGVCDERELSFYTRTPFDDRYKCREEVFDRESGRKDIVIERLSCEKDKRFCVVVENKIGAGEQEGQLRRYWEYLEEKPVHSKRKFLVYLHAKGAGHKPQSGSGIRCTILRYQDHICGMLEKCLTHVKSRKVRDLLSQYLDVVRSL